MPNAHETFKALGPVEWDSFFQDDLAMLMTDIFNDAHRLIGSIPSPPKEDQQKAGNKGAAADADLRSLPSRAAESSDQARELRKEWKEVKVNLRDNPFGLTVYKLAAKDGKGAWFARRSIHEGTSFKKWKAGMEREFAESLKIQGRPGDGKIRGLGADKCVVDQTVDGCGKIQVYQLSAQFPGPTTPRDFVTLCLSSDDTPATPTSNGNGKPRSYMLVSKPCIHPECPPRQGFIRGYYESVEIIRELRVGRPRRTPSSAGTRNGAPSTPSGSDRVDEEPAISTLRGDDESGSKVDEHEGIEGLDEDDPMVEWLMITRSDPGGSVPRFMIEKKTPEGITNDAGKFIQWISSEKFKILLNTNFEPTQTTVEAAQSVARTSNIPDTSSNSNSRSPKVPAAKSGPEAVEANFPESPGPGGVYGMISGALSMVASAAASRLLGPSAENESESEISSSESHDDSSIHSFHSFDVTDDPEPAVNTPDGEEPTPSVSTGAGGDSLNSTESASMGSSQHDKELRKLEERRRKAEEKLRRAEERALARKNDDAQRDQLALQKLREKHDREIAKQCYEKEEKFQRERRKLEAKRASEEKKAEERRRKQAEREQKANLALELDKTRTERDIARREIEILAEQVGQLQAMNTKLVARLGREGISLDDVLTPSSRSGGLTPSNLSRSVTEQDLLKPSNGVKS
ncbi:hypothetical protein NUW58_g4144 [Xylaria curta]|uniref:Uncharacterized protein n=1 Tax=Xylaria curta TaxID=42375 RepID=A0ACC1P7N8_9PEZI|nr:hypothetical protein NUW58_g4144 [Xylaria curta]